MYQYRLTVNGSSHIHKKYPSEQWEKIFEQSEFRGGIEAKLEQRLLTNKVILKMVENTKGFIVIGDSLVACPWDVLAEIKNI